MIGASIPSWAIIVMAVMASIGAALCVFALYYAAYYSDSKKDDDGDKFARRYAVAAVLSAICGAFSGFVCSLGIVWYVGINVDALPTYIQIMAVFLAAVPGAVCALIWDALVFHNIADGTGAKAAVAVREVARATAKSSAAKSAAIAAAKALATSAGIKDETVLSELDELVDEGTSQETIEKLISMMTLAQKSKEVLA